PAARDYKRAFDGDRGPNTGGMGAVAPSAAVDGSLEQVVPERTLPPMLRARAARGTPYRGVLYAGLMLTDRGPSVVEFNCRFGDPETQVLMPRLWSEPAELFLACARGELGSTRGTAR